MPAASMSGHLCLVPGITRGAKKILLGNAVLTTAALAGAAGHPALQQHTGFPGENAKFCTVTSHRALDETSTLINLCF
jgi:predicted RecB family nuclease